MKKLGEQKLKTSTQNNCLVTEFHPLKEQWTCLQQAQKMTAEKMILETTAMPLSPEQGTTSELKKKIKYTFEAFKSDQKKRNVFIITISIGQTEQNSRVSKYHGQNSRNGFRTIYNGSSRNSIYANVR